MNIVNPDQARIEALLAEIHPEVVPGNLHRHKIHNYGPAHSPDGKADYVLAPPGYWFVYYSIYRADDKPRNYLATVKVL